ncbi:peptidylprolyl isomerase [Rhodococcus rhodnii]|uniref:Peptidyl-prolyl cis-trans isomerase n=2 Tax=Rhodococcus rhodnii TaxID=38312 RepID=R7WKR6_9NOCA|nr:peptidylprolyl isomerase [Rhodococcus rhodnii]EOM75893.1 peptidylprolyl isomerase B [Rhodococcus rhodnii LMG 5362]TXG91058.1 peptidylprolyl isomerase [Rhodococcus rhodnii]
MPSNEQRRAAAKRKLERQLERRAQRARRRTQLTIAGAAVGVVVVVAAVTAVVTLTGGDDADTDTTATTAAPPEAGVLPSGRAEPLPELVSCEYPASPQPAAKPVEPPRTDGIDTTLETVSVSMETNRGDLGLVLDNATSPCTVNSFVSLASQGYFDATTCHRLTTGDALKVLQCGDPAGSGAGGPGYQFANEFPTDQYSDADPAAQQPVTYPRGTLAMANAGPDTNGSQFFLVYGDSQLPPQYTVFGTVDETGLATLDEIAAEGSDDANGPGDGAPTQPVDITSIRMD